MVDNLSERPPLLDSPDPEPVWPYGKEERGFLLSSFTTNQLLGKRKWLEARNSRGDLDWLIEEIDRILTQRGGE